MRVLCIVVRTVARHLEALEAFATTKANIIDSRNLPIKIVDQGLSVLEMILLGSRIFPVVESNKSDLSLFRL